MDSVLIIPNKTDDTINYTINDTLNDTLNDMIDDSSLWRCPTHCRIEVYIVIIFLGLAGFVGLCAYVFIKR